MSNYSFKNLVQSCFELFEESVHVFGELVRLQSKRLLSLPSGLLQITLTAKIIDRKAALPS